MDDLLLSADSIDELTIISREATSLFQSRRFKLRKWVANSRSKSVLSGMPPSDLGSSLRKVDLWTQPMPDSKALGLVWDVEDDKLRVSSRQPLGSVSTRREMLRELANQFDPLDFLAPWLLPGKLIFHNTTKLGCDWDDKLPKNILKDWNAWVDLMKPVAKFSINRCFFPLSCVPDTNAVYQLHEYCDGSNCAISCVVYLHRTSRGRSNVAFVQGKSKIITVNQVSWVISRKELEISRMCAMLMVAIRDSLRHLGCSIHFSSDS